MNLQEKAGWIGMITAIVVPLGAWLGKIIHGRIQRRDGLQDIEIATRREETAKWHQQREDLIVDLRLQLQMKDRLISERDARIVTLTDRLIETERQAAKDVALAAAVIRSSKRTESRPVSSGTTRPKSQPASESPTVERLPKPPLLPR